MIKKELENKRKELLKLEQIEFRREKALKEMGKTKKLKKAKGITLIALIITIIILIILAGISIASLSGQNGILNKAIYAKEEQRGASVQEAKDLWEINNEANEYAQNSNSESLSELLTRLVNEKLLTEDEKDEIIGNEEKGIEATGKVEIGSRTKAT